MRDLVLRFRPLFGLERGDTLDLEQTLRPAGHASPVVYRRAQPPADLGKPACRPSRRHRPHPCACMLTCRRSPEPPHPPPAELWCRGRPSAGPQPRPGRRGSQRQPDQQEPQLALPVAWRSPAPGPPRRACRPKGIDRSARALFIDAHDGQLLLREELVARLM